MAFVRRGIGDSDSDINSGSPSRELFSAVRWVAIPCVAVFVAAWSVAALASLHSAAERVSAGSFVQASLPTRSQLNETPRRERIASAVAAARKTARLADAVGTTPEVPAARLPADPFGKVIAEAKLSREKLHAAFARAGMAIADAVDMAMAMPIDERFHRAAHASGRLSTAALGAIGLPAGIAYAAVEARTDNPVELAMASLALDPYGIDGEEAETDEEYPPQTVALPSARPDVEPADDSQEPEPTLAYARPDKPAVDAFKGLFGKPGAGNRVAVYDISAAVVHMPDGTKLEAHSGIGKMADNPRYVHVKMKGPTPPNTYKLTMREKLFHGVQAIRMTPIGEQSMHGRDGMLAHSYLLRGRREESHGCVAFANYPKFLKAFKQGRVTHMVVVPSMSKMPKVQMVSSRDRGA